MPPPVAILASLGVALAAFVLIAFLARRATLLSQLSAPFYLAAVAGALKIYLLLVPKSPAWLVDTYEWALLFVPIVLVLRLLALYFFDYHLKIRKSVTLPTMISGVAIWTAYVLTAFLTLRIFFPEFDAKTLAATSAVTSLVLGLALQPILANFFAGLVIAAERPFRINDWIKVGDTEGRVTAITWRTTHLRTRDNDNLIIPNGKLADESLLNFYLPHPVHLERIEVGVHYSTPPYRVKRALMECVKGVDGVLESPTPEVFLLAFADSAINYELRLWIADMAGAPRIGSEVRSKIWEVFKQQGISIPYPIRTLEVAPRPRRRVAGERPGARLFVTDGPDRGTGFVLHEGQALVGRSRGCNLTLSDPQASKEHLRIEWKEGDFWLSDLGSSFGTKVAGEPVTLHRLADLDRISIGDSVIVFELHDE